MKKLGQIYYNTFMFPFEKLLLGKLRKRLVSKAKGKVLEIGFGTGINQKYYNYSDVESLTMVDKNPYYDKQVIEKYGIKVIEADAMNLPFDSGEFDTVVFTLVFCSVDNPEVGLSEVYRVLKDNGSIIFIEHVLPEKELTKKVVNKVNGSWNSISNGCNVNRETTTTIRDTGFVIDETKFSRNGVFISGTAKKEDC